MRTFLITSLCFAVCLNSALMSASPRSAEEILSPGGLTSVDIFSYQQKQKSTHQKKKKNLLPMEKEFWSFYSGANRGDVPGKWDSSWSTKEKAMRNLIKNSVRLDENNIPVFVFKTPEAINQYRQNERPVYWNRLMPKKLQPVQPGYKYEITYRLKGKAREPAGSNRFVLTVEQYGKDKKRNPKARSGYYIGSLSPSWKTQKVTVIAESGTCYLNVHYGLQGIGQAELQTGSLEEQPMSDGFNMRLFPMGLLDNKCALASRQVNFIGFCPINESGRLPKAPRLELTMPENIEVLCAAPWMRPGIENRQKNPDGTITYRLGVKVYEWEKLARKDYSNTFPTQVAVTTAAIPSDRLYKISYQAVDGEYRAPVEHAWIQIIPPILGEQPKSFLNGAHDYRTTLADPPTFKKFAEEYAARGFNVFHNYNCPEYITDAIRAQGILCQGDMRLISNGFAGAPPPEKRPSYTHFIGIDGKPSTDYNGRFNLFCPNTVIDRTPYYQNVILKEARENLKNRDYLMANWEPGSAQTSNGCFCEKCRKAFIKYTGLPENEVNACWPEQIIAKYRTKWMNFKSFQHAQYLITFEKDLEKISREMGRRESGFMPMITRDLILDSEFNLTDANAFAVRFYADKIKWIEPWGPYLAHHWKDLQRDLPGNRIKMLTMARSGRRFLKKVIQDPAKYPKLLAFPIGISVNMLVSPEQLAMDTLSVYVGGWDGSTPYYFPSNYDARYWKALSDCSTAIARTESCIYKGNPQPDIRTEILTAYPPPLYAEIDSPGKLISSLQTDVFEKNSRLTIAAGNFWEYGEVFFKIHLPRLAEKKYYRIKEVMTGAEFTFEGRKRFTGRQLAEGIILHAGALRWIFYAAEPVNQDQSDAEIVISQQKITTIMNQRKAGILKAAQEENVFLSKNIAPPEAPADCSKLADAIHGEISADVKTILPPKSVKRISAYDSGRTEGEQMRSIITVTGKDSIWTIAPDKGAFISSWKFLGKEMSFPENNFGLLKDGPWHPASIFGNPFNLTDVKKTDNGLILEFKRTLNFNDKKTYDRLQITKHFLFQKNRVELTTTVANPHSDTVRFAYRYQNVPGPMQNYGNSISGFILGKGPSGVIHYTRKNRNHYFKIKNAPLEDSIMKNLFGTSYSSLPPHVFADMTTTITSPNITFVSNDQKTCLTMKAAPAIDVNGFAIWDSDSCMTFEPIFNTREIAVGQHWSAKITLEAQEYTPDNKKH